MPHNPEKTAQNDQPARAIRVASLAGRGLAIAALAWVGISTGTAMTSLFSSEVVQRQPENTPTKLATIPPIAAELLRGHWEFDGLPVTIELLQAANNNIEEIIAIPPVDAKEATPINAEESGLLSLMISRLQVLQKTADLTVQGIDEPSVRVRLFSRSATEIIGGYVAVPRGDGNWQVIAIRGLAERTASTAKQQPLISLPDSSRQLATRHGLNGKLQCELITLGCRFEQAWDLWRRAGWTAEELPTAAPQSNSFLLKRGTEVLQVYGLAANGNSSQLLLIVRGSVPSH